MEGIKANANPVFVFNPVDDKCKLFKFKSQVGSLSGGIFDNRCYSFGFIQCNIDGISNAFQAFFWINLF